MRCEKAIPLISEYLDGELDLALAAEMVFHLRGCEDCCVATETTRRTIELYATMELTALPQGVSRRLHRTLVARLRPDCPESGVR